MGEGKLKNERLSFVKIKCPFYMQSNNTSITCEGFINGSRSTKQTFPDAYNMAEFVRKHCQHPQPDCEIFRLLQMKYNRK